MPRTATSWKRKTRKRKKRTSSPRSAGAGIPRAPDAIRDAGTVSKQTDPDDPSNPSLASGNSIFPEPRRDPRAFSAGSGGSTRDIDWQLLKQGKRKADSEFSDHRDGF